MLLEDIVNCLGQFYVWVVVVVVVDVSCSFIHDFGASPCGFSSVGL